MARLSVDYIVACEWLLAASFGGGGILLLFLAFWGETSLGGVLLISVLIALGGVSGYTAVGLTRLKAWSVSASFAIGIATVALGVKIMWMTMHLKPNQSGDADEGVVIGFAMLVFAVPALILLALPSTRNYVRLGKEG